MYIKSSLHFLELFSLELKSLFALQKLLEVLLLIWPVSRRVQHASVGLLSHVAQAAPVTVSSSPIVFNSSLRAKLQVDILVDDLLWFLRCHFYYFVI